LLLPVTRKYLVNALAGTPTVVEALLNTLTPGDPRWDLRPDPERFTLREVVAHLADWEPISLGRLRRTCAESEPRLPDVDEDRVALDNDYAHGDPYAGLERFRRERQVLVQFLREATPEAWERIGYREPHGPMNLEAQAVQILGHDGYHTQQIAEWVEKG